MTSDEIISIGQRTIRQEGESIEGLHAFIDESFVRAVNMISDCKGRIVVSGIGKSAIIAQKIVATFNSTGTPSIFMHAADAIHGDVGMIQQEDTVIIISKSGDSPEIKVLVPLILNFNNPVIAICGQSVSFLAHQATIFLNTTVSQEACPNNLAPTSSTTAQMVMGDALAICLMENKGFGSEEFAKFHPGGTLGKKLYMRVSDLYVYNEKPGVQGNSSLKDVIIEITNKRLGVTAVTDENEALLGVITDGDLRRMLEKNTPLDKLTAKDIMSLHPKKIDAGSLAVEALDIMRKSNITQLIVTRNDKYEGVIHLHDIVREGII